MKKELREPVEFAAILKQAGFRATPGRITLLRTLWETKHPIRISSLLEKMDYSLNTVTLYRALQSLVTAGLVREVDLRHGHAHYEIAVARPHHHHITCTTCGRIEDFEQCDLEIASKKILRRSVAFRSIDTHSLELFGLCTMCTKRA